MYLIFIHFQADIFSGISWIFFALAGKHLPVCTFWSLRSKTFPLSVRKWEPFCCPAAMPEPCILFSKPWLCPWLYCLIISRAQLFQFPSFSTGSLLMETLWLDFRWSLAQAGSFSGPFKHCLSPWLTGRIEPKEEFDERKGGSFSNT